MNLNHGDSLGALEKPPALCKVTYSLKNTSMDPSIPFNSLGSFVGHRVLWWTDEEIKVQGWEEWLWVMRGWRQGQEGLESDSCWVQVAP